VQGKGQQQLAKGYSFLIASGTIAAAAAVVAKMPKGKTRRIIPP
jgi:hypothetical protein